MNWSERVAKELPTELDVAPSGKREHGEAMMRDGERLRRIYEELRMIRVAVTESRAWRSE